MVNPRERYNAKARQSTAGGSTHKGKVAARHRAEAGVDSNVDLIVPGSEEDERRKEMERARREVS